jgi:hypothetical protein
MRTFRTRPWLVLLALAALAAPCARAAEPGRDDVHRKAGQACGILEAGPTYAMGSHPEAEAWLLGVVETKAVGEAAALRETIRARKIAQDIPPGVPEDQLPDDQRAVAERETGRFAQRLRKVYEPVLAAKTLREKLAALYPKADKTAESDDLTRAWLKRRLQDTIRLCELDRFPALGPEAVEREVRAIFDLGPRTVGHAGHRPVREHVAARFRQAGLAPVFYDTFVRAAPIDLGARLYVRDQGPGTRHQGLGTTTAGLGTGEAGLGTTDKSGIRNPESGMLYAVWPNQAMPSSLPDGGVEGPLVYLGSGRLKEADGSCVAGAIALMEFNSAANWQWAAMLGAKALIFLHGPGMSRGEAADKFINLPVAFPRYYADEALSGRLRDLAKTGGTVRLEGKMGWRNVECGSVMGVLPATALQELHAALRQQLTQAIQSGDAGHMECGAGEKDSRCRFCAAPFGPFGETTPGVFFGSQSGGSAAALHRPVCDWPEPLVQWALRRHLKSDERDQYPARVADLLGRLSGARQAVLLVAPLDSMACAPAAPHGADQSAALVALEALADYLAKADPLPRTRSVIFLALDSQFQAMYGGRSLARVLLRGADHFAGEAAAQRRVIRTTEQVLAILADPAALASAAPEVRATLKADLGTWMNSRRIDVVTARRNLESERLARQREAGRPEAKSVAEVGHEIHLAYYKAAAKIKDLGDLLAVMALVEDAQRAAETPGTEGPTSEPPATASGAGETDPARGEKDTRCRFPEGPEGCSAETTPGVFFASRIEKAASRRAMEALPPDVRAALRAAMTPQDVTVAYARRRYEARQAAALARLEAAEEDRRLAVTLDGFSDRDRVGKLAASLKEKAGPPGAPGLAEAEARLVRLARDDQFDIRVAYCLDLASHSTQLTLRPQGSTAMAGGGLPGTFQWTTVPNLSQRFAKTAAFYNTVLFPARPPLFVDTVTADVSRLHRPSDGSSPTATLTLAQVTAYALVTAEDQKYQWNTPADVPARVDASALSVQMKTAAALVGEVLADEALQVEVKRIQSKETDIHGRIVKFDIRAGPFPNMPVPGALVYLVRGGGTDRGGKGASQTGGILTHLAVLADSDGHYFMPLEPRDGTGTPLLWAYGFDESRGQINLAIDAAESQTVRLSNRLKLRDPVERRDLLVFDCAAVAVFDPVDPRYLRQLQTVQVLDGRSKSQPRHYAALGPEQTKGKAGDADAKANAAVAFVPQGLNVQIMMGEKELGARRFVLLGGSPQDPAGVGYPVGRGRLIQDTSLHVAEDMARLNADRLARLGRAGIRSTKLDDLAVRAADHLDRAKRALAEFRYSQAVRLAKAAWGYAARAYPEVTDTANDAVYGVVFFLVLLLPFAYFLERLTFGSKTAVYRVLGMTVWFALVFVVLYWVHPAFEISLTPLVILLAFTLLVLASVVLVLVSARFGEQVKKWRQQAAGVHSADVSRLSTTAVAFSLGIANLGKRKGRTVLVVVTLVLLAFSVISFTSIQQASDYLPISLGAGAPYDGLFFRMPHWKDMPDSIFTSLEVEFEGRHTVVKRGWRMEIEGGWGQWVRHANEMPLVRTDRPDLKTPIHCLAGFEAAEKDLTHIDTCVTAGRWMAEGEEDVILLPASVAEALAVTAADAEAGRIRLAQAGRTFTVIGLFDAAQADAIRGLNAEPIAPIDYMASGSEGGAVGAGGVGSSGAESEVGLERPFEHLKFTDTPMAIAPLQTVRKMSHSRVKAVCVKFRDGSRANGERGMRNAERATRHAPSGSRVPSSGSRVPSSGSRVPSSESRVPSSGSRVPSSEFRVPSSEVATETEMRHEAIVDELMSRLAINVYAGLGGERFLIRSVGLKTIRPDWTLLAPVILAILIILNTMLGTVEERKGEISMLGAVGLAPRHVAMLFFTEASVYANAGVVVGYLVGQVMAKLVVSLGLFQELSLNYSSLAAVFTAALVGGIVLAATVYPARKAAALATPSGAARWAMPQPRAGRRLLVDLPFTLTRGNAVGMAQFLHEYFEGHSDPTSPDFATARLRTRARVQRAPAGACGGATRNAERGTRNHGDGAPRLTARPRQVPGSDFRVPSSGWAPDGQALLALQMLVYPAPYDLGVSQRCRVVVFPTSRQGVYGVRFSLRRLSSDEGSWMRTNFRFLDLIRKQFLIWRTIRLDQRQRYIERGLELFP